MRLIIRNLHTYVEFEEGEMHLKDVFLKRIHTTIGARQQGFQFSPAYKRGSWDGYIDFYDYEEDRFPSGLLFKVEALLGELQEKYNFQYTLTDERDEAFLAEEDIDESIDLLDNKIGKITLRDYQYEAVLNSLIHYNGILHMATNAGKCIDQYTNILTAYGYQTLEDIFQQHDIILDEEEEVIPIKYPLINRYGKVEYTSHFTKNGLKKTKDIITNYGFTLTSTYNHPLLVLEDFNEVWKKTEDIQVGDIIISRKGDNIFHESDIDEDESYLIGYDFYYTHASEIDKSITQATREVQVAFLEGYISSRENIYLPRKVLTLDGETVEVLKQMQLMLFNLGVEAKLNPNASLTILDIQELIKIFDDNNYTSRPTIVYQEVKSIREGKVIPTFDVCMPRTHSFIANTLINHNTEIASGIIDQLKPQLERGERIAFFTGSTEIFNQSADRIEERLNIKVGKIGAGKFDVQQVTVVMIPTLNANMKDPSQGVKLTPKQNISKRIAKDILPRFEGGSNQRKLLGMLIHSMVVKTKVDQTIKDELTRIYDTCGTDAKVLMELRNHNAKYQEALRGKNTKKYDKYKQMRDFLDSVTVMLVDEAHHSKSDSWYNNLMTCENALYRIALTGSIDKEDQLLWMRLQALFGDVINRTTNKFLIEEGHSAKPTINMIPIANPNDIDKISEYRDAYDVGVTNNTFRNKLIAKLTEKWYNQDKGTLIIVNFIQHGENISAILDELGVEHYFLHGEVDSDTRKEKLSDMRNGKLKVMIATSLIDEGVDISGINALILGAGGKSLRQALQRVGRALRKKAEDNTCQIFDFMDMTNKFLYNHSKQRVGIYEEEEFEIKYIGKE